MRKVAPTVFSDGNEDEEEEDDEGTLKRSSSRRRRRTVHHRRDDAVTKDHLAHSRDSLLDESVSYFLTIFLTMSLLCAGSCNLTAIFDAVTLSYVYTCFLVLFLVVTR